MKFFKKKKTEVTLFLILALSVFLTFVNFNNRWGLAYDQARDVIIASYAFQNHLFPLIGPFSASGPFVFGPYMYWIYILITSLYPSSILLPWIFVASASSFICLLMYLIGKEILNKNFGFLLAFLTSISVARITQATDLTYSTFLSFLSVIILYVLVKTLKSGKEIYFFLLSLLIGLAVNIHFQAVGMLFIFLLVPFFTKLSFKKILFSFLGFTIPFIPLIIFDFISNHYQSSHLFSYFLSGGNSASLPKRWLTYLTVFWPRSFSRVFGGYYQLGYVLGFLILFSAVYSVIKKKISREIYFLIIYFLLIFITLRYFKGNVYDSFLMFINPVLIVLTGWAFYLVHKINKSTAIILFLIFTLFTFAKDYEEIKNATNNTTFYSRQAMERLTEKFPGEKFAFYDLRFKSSQRSFPVVLHFTKNDLINDNGKKIGFISATSSAELKTYNLKVVTDSPGGYYLVDIDKKSHKELLEENWVFINPSGIYESTEEWYKDEEKLQI